MPDGRRVFRCCIRCGRRRQVNPGTLARVCRDCKDADPWFTAQQAG